MFLFYLDRLWLFNYFVALLFAYLVALLFIYFVDYIIISSNANDISNKRYFKNKRQTHNFDPINERYFKINDISNKQYLKQNNNSI